MSFSLYVNLFLSCLDGIVRSLLRNFIKYINFKQCLVVFCYVIIGFIAIGMTIDYFEDKSKSRSKENSLAPYLDRSKSGRVRKIERFSHYVARQLGFKDESECPALMKLAYEYLKGSKEFDEKMYEYLEKDANAQELYLKLVEEFERCILGYFAFHWRQTPLMITQVLRVNFDQKKLKDLAATSLFDLEPVTNPENQSSTSGFVSARADTTRYGTFSTNVEWVFDYRKQRFEKTSEDLKLTRKFSTLVEEMKVISTTSNKELNQSEVMVPVALSERSPVLLLIGGGIGASKRTVLKDIKKKSFWLGAIANAVEVEADAFKEMDVTSRALSSKGHHQDKHQTDELVHQSSTDVASSNLVTALNDGLDVIMYGTLSWITFVEQTICMIRNVHKHRYRRGEGYQVSEDGTFTENYWEQIERQDKTRKPYRIELVGVTCDAYLAVVRGIRRAIQMGRAVEVKSQLKSHKIFASAFPRYCQLVDNVRLYCTNALGGPPKLIAWKDGDSKLLVDPDEMKCFDSISDLNDYAETIHELYKESDYITQPGFVWKDIVLLPKRGSLQQELKIAIKRIEVNIS